MKIKALIFDVDGVILDSEPLSLQGFNEVLKKFGVHIDMPTFKAKYMGRRGKHISELIVKDYSLPISGDAFTEQKGRAHSEIVEKAELSATPGLLSLLETLHSMFPLALASNSRMFEKYVEKLGIREYFQVAVSGHNVPNGKPAPDIYLETARQLGVPPKDCAVIEDTPAGIAAAKAAGMKCVALVTTHTKEELIQADRVINGFEELIPVLQSLDSV